MVIIIKLYNNDIDNSSNQKFIESVNNIIYKHKIRVKIIQYYLYYK